MKGLTFVVKGKISEEAKKKLDKVLEIRDKRITKIIEDYNLK